MTATMTTSLRVLVIDDHRSYAEALSLAISIEPGFESIGAVPDVESAILALAEDMAEAGNDRLTRIVRESDWKGKRGYDAAEAIADAYIQFWDDNAALMRVLDLTSLEGDERFRSIRVRLLNEVTIALAGVVEAQRAAGKHPDDLDPMAVAGVLVSMLAHVASHRAGFEGYDIGADDLRRSMARIVFTSVCGTKPPR